MTFINPWFSKTDATISALIWQSPSDAGDGAMYEAVILRRNQEQTRVRARRYSDVVALLEQTCEGTQ